MQQITYLRRRWVDREQWVRLGVLSASVVAPLLSRWNELRAAERAQDLRAQAEERLRDLRGSVPLGRRTTQRQIEEIVRQVADVADVADEAAAQKASSKLWLIGVAVGLAAAGGAAYVLVRRQLSLHADEPLVELQVASSNGHRTDGLQNNLNGHHGEATAPAAADAAVSALAEQAEAPEAIAPEAVPGPAPAVDVYSSGQDAAAARFIGDIYTKVYHEAGADAVELPSEANRIYFLTEDEARTAGYRRDREEVASAGDVEGQAGE